ncbi:hypothetical protein BDN71DRAFT_488249 [Pleurotus eryngii]|uniref:Uncharacterized protein n=1 Tax=Pleurotus eryngii TaxID=5323 RepID=A0A9P6A9L7_PLEER|nr:hypothetical protein BDN71DRAFT_488249 [Pleurotus eryngii]
MTKSKSSPLQIRVHRGFIQCSYVTECYQDAMGIATTMKGALKADFTASSLSQDSTRSPTIPARSGEATSDMRSMESGSVSQPGNAWSSPTQKSSPLASVKGFLKTDLSAPTEHRL